MNMKLRFTVFAMIAVPLGTGCILVDKDTVDDIKDDITNEIPQSKNTLRIDAIADGSGKTHVIACVADPVLCRNAEGPFSAAIGDTAAVNLPFVVDYQESGTDVGRFQGDLTGDMPESTITVTHNNDPNAKSTATLPAPALITAPMEGAAISLAKDQIKLTWDSKGGTDSMEWSATVECSTPATEITATKIDDTGEFVVDPAKLNLKAGETCKVALHLSRWRDGTIETAYKGTGLITAKQTRTVNISVGP